jgi:Holliday junction resolvase RusA-like endonuclease
MNQLSLFLFEIPISLNKYLNLHWAEKSAYKKNYADLIWATFLTVKPKGFKPFEKCEVILRYYFPTKAIHDFDNYSGKVVFDGLKQAGILTDDNSKVVKKLTIEFYNNEIDKTQTPGLQIEINEINS